MSAEVVILLATAVLAVVTITAAIVAVRAARVVRAAPETAPEPARIPSAEVAIFEPRPVTPSTLPARIVEGVVVVPPSQQQVVATALGRPHVRLSIISRGIGHALRPESRDRIVALMRREYRQRRRERLKAGRQAVRAANPTGSDTWMSS